MRTVNLKISDTGATLLAHPGAKPGPGDRMIYAINNVPSDVTAGQVALKVSHVCLMHNYDDLASWSYEWAELANVPDGTIINKYRREA